MTPAERVYSEQMMARLSEYILQAEQHWRFPQIVCAKCYRPLQPNECCECFAPFAAELLPCYCSMRHPHDKYIDQEHIRACPAYYRPQVAAALAEKDEIIKEQAERIREYLRRLG